MARQSGKVTAGIAAMAKGLADKPFCSGVHFSLSDVAVGCALGWTSLRHPQVDWRAEHANLAKLYEKLMQRPSFCDTQPA